MDTLRKILETPEDMQREARAFIEALPFEADRATLVTLSGDLGAGKTTFTQFVSQALGITDVVTSPTFVIEKMYVIPQDNRFARLVHIDAYRLQSIGDLTTLGFDQLMSSPDTLVFLEWPEQVVGIAEQATVQIMLEVLPDGSRQIIYA